MSLPDGTSKTVHATLRAVVDEAGLDIMNMSNFSGDGASVNSGVNNGAAICFTRENALSVFNHCGGHKSQLASADAANRHREICRYCNRINRNYWPPLRQFEC